MHRRLGRTEELVTREADIAQLLKRAGEGSKAGLVTAEALYQAGALADAAAAYAALPTPLGPRARALVEVRRLQLTPLSQPLVAPVLPEGEGSAEVEVALLAAQLRRGLASLPSASVSTRVPLLAVAALRGSKSVLNVCWAPS